jgi:ABC-type sugar transport system permease subunit
MSRNTIKFLIYLPLVSVFLGFLISFLLDKPFWNGFIFGAATFTLVWVCSHFSDFFKDSSGDIGTSDDGGD